MNIKDFSLLTELLSQPTAPFREYRVRDVVVKALQQNTVPYFMDTVGNVIVGASNKSEYIKKIKARCDEPVRLFIAHMDHPGFHGKRWLDNGRLQIKWHGGSPVKYLHGADMYVTDGKSFFATATLRKARLVKGKWAIHTAELVFPARIFKEKCRPAARKLYGSFRFRKPWWLRGKRLYTNAADDLCGVFAILHTAITLYKGGHASDAPFLGLLTRGEEVGFVGVVAHFELGWLQQYTRPLVVVSLEASRTLPGVHIGKGPVVRLGDRRTVFHANSLKILSDVAEKVLKAKHQKRIMDGGACEATVATVYGFPVVGISLPLGNYHNQGHEGGEDSLKPGGPAPEFVHMDDINAELKLCKALLRPGLNWRQPWSVQHRRLIRNMRQYMSFLK